MNTRQKTDHSIKWQVTGNVIQKVVSFFSTVLLARILSPEDYGMFALALIVTNTFGLFKSMGIDTALIKRTADFQKACNTAFLIIPPVMICFLR